MRYTLEHNDMNVEWGKEVQVTSQVTPSFPTPKNGVEQCIVKQVDINHERKEEEDKNDNHNGEEVVGRLDKLHL